MGQAGLEEEKKGLRIGRRTTGRTDGPFLQVGTLVEFLVGLWVDWAQVAFGTPVAVSEQQPSHSHLEAWAGHPQWPTYMAGS